MFNQDLPINHLVLEFFFFFFLIFLVILGFELRASHWPGRHSTTRVTPCALFCVGFFQDRVCQTHCPGWPRTTTLLISASWVAGITSMSHCILLEFIFAEDFFPTSDNSLVDWSCLIFHGWALLVNLRNTCISCKLSSVDRKMLIISRLPF
jgi:hypothetical protein